jgi:hypothetical protein
MLEASTVQNKINACKRQESICGVVVRVGNHHSSGSRFEPLVSQFFFISLFFPYIILFFSHDFSNKRLFIIFSIHHCIVFS